jgi:hypothetical protein
MLHTLTAFRHELVLPTVIDLLCKLPIYSDHTIVHVVCLNVLIINYCIWFVSELIQEVFPDMTRASINVKIAEMLKPYNRTRKDI